SPIAFCARGRIEYILGNYEGANLYLSRAIALDSGYTSALLTRGALLTDQRRVSKALADLNFVLNQDLSNVRWSKLEAAIGGRVVFVDSANINGIKAYTYVARSRA